MDSYKVTFTHEKQFFLGNPTVKVIVDDKAVCELKIKTGDTATVDIPYGLHRLTLVGSGKRLDSEIFVNGDGTIQLKWNKTFGKPGISNLGIFDPAQNIVGVDKSAEDQEFDENIPVDISFGVTKAVGNFLWINENKRTVAVPKTNLFGAVTGLTTFKYEDILDFELIQDGKSVINKGGLGRAAIGGLLFGGSGAIVGTLTGSRKQTETCTELRVKITLNNIERPSVFIDFVKGTSISKGNILYRQLANAAETVMSLLQVITNETFSNEPTSSQEKSGQVSSADEIRKYKGLLDDGIISQEEFDAKKRQLLDL